MVYGEEPERGLRARAAFCIPSSASPSSSEDFPSTTPRRRCSASRKAGGQALCGSTSCACRRSQTLADYLNSGWIENNRSEDSRGRHHQWAAGGDATAKGDQWVFRLYAVLFGSDVYRFIYASKRTTPDIDRAFRESSAPFRRMTLAESQAAKPMTIKVVIVEPSETVERLAGRMAVADRQVERFSRPNGLAPSDRVTPGDLMKIIVE